MALNESDRKTAVEESAQEEQREKTDPAQKTLYRYETRRPAELEAGPVDEEEYQLYRSTTDLREPYRIGKQFLEGTKKFSPPDITEAPLIVFINSRSGGRAGPKLTEILYQSLGHAQVYDLQEYRPGPVLKKIWQNFEAREAQGDQIAPIIRSRFRVLAAGGDGTVAWILKTVKELRLDPPPLLAVMPLGTGNDLSLSFGWGNTFLPAWINKHNTIYETLKRVADSEARDLDCWQISLSANGSGAFQNLPHSLEVADGAGAGTSKVSGLFWNYFSLGLDAEAAYGFHHLRESKPWAASGRLVNQAWYSYFSCTTGWFCMPPPISAKATLKVKDKGGQWVEVVLPSSVKALVLLNLQSYGGGRDLWGLADTQRDKAKGWSTPIFNDGLIEVLGLQGGYHTALVMGGVNKKIHAKRLAQAAEVLVELRSPPKAEAMTHMQLDGEPWPQALPPGESQPIQVHIKQAGRSRMLFNSMKLRGIAPKIQKLATREGQVSVQSAKSEKPLPNIRHSKPTVASTAASQELQLQAVTPSPQDSPGLSVAQSPPNQLSSSEAPLDDLPVPAVGKVSQPSPGPKSHAI